MRSKKDILEASDYDAEDTQEWRNWILQRCLLEVLIDLRDVLRNMSDNLISVLKGEA